MGRQSLVSHAGSSKHMKYATVHDKTQYRMTSFLRSPDDRLPSIMMSASNVTVKSDIHKDAGSVDSMKTQSENVGNTAVTVQIEPEPSHVIASLSVNTGRSQCIVGYTSNDQVTRAEIVRCLKCITSHLSYNSSSDIKGIFQLMFPDSSIAQRMTIGSTKMAYKILYGLAPYFHSTLLTNIQKCPKIVVCFDEAMNRIAQRGQMDVVIRYWDDNAKAVSARYFGSAFMGHVTAECLLTSFKEEISPLPIGSLLQVSMDGPAVNWKFLDLLAINLDEDMTQTKLLELGSCGLHVIHGAMQYGHKASGWAVNAYLRVLYGLFRDSPARRADYIAITGSVVFAHKFCQMRWVENVAVAERALDIIPNVKKYLKETKSLPKTITCDNVKDLYANKLAEAKISFFILSV